MKNFKFTGLIFSLCLHFLSCQKLTFNNAGDSLSVAFLQTVLFRDLIRPASVPVVPPVEVTPTETCDTSVKWSKTLGDATNSVYVTTILSVSVQDIIIAGSTRKNLGTGKKFNFSGTEGTTQNWFIAKLNGKDGSIVWVDYFGETMLSIAANAEFPTLIRLGKFSNGEIGVFWEAKDAQSGALQAKNLTYSFGAARYDLEGVRKWHTYLNLSTNGGNRFSSAIDASDNIHFFVEVSAAGGLEGFPAPTNSVSGGQEILYGLITGSGGLLSQKYITSVLEDKIGDAVSFGTAIFLGGNAQDNLNGFTGHPATGVGINKIFIAKLDSSQNISSVLYRGSASGSSNTELRKLTADATDLYYVGNSNDSYGSPISAYQASGKNFLYEKISSNLTPTWLTFLGATSFNVTDGLRTALLAPVDGTSFYAHLLSGSNFARFTGLGAAESGDGSGFFQKTLVKVNKATGAYEKVVYSSNFASPKIASFTNTKEICSGKMIRMDMVVEDQNNSDRIFSELSVFPTSELP
ncbi:hypothetical protein EHQ58_06440 [Leptospira ognonensis]|uniref:Uncharacterized protein n=1 Tax=Leptospira ognonensis TaxID=2484945 RepID=A0A4V3JRG0_9LEPT|nr:hypothetical protein [Leptospira ognonensis]TGL60135.1 hypothetical protein EHQ58_06440 [Leptospira ognonensis]